MSVFSIPYLVGGSLSLYLGYQTYNSYYNQKFEYLEIEEDNMTPEKKNIEDKETSASTPPPPPTPPPAIPAPPLTALPAPRPPHTPRPPRTALPAPPLTAIPAPRPPNTPRPPLTAIPAPPLTAIPAPPLTAIPAPPPPTTPRPPSPLPRPLTSSLTLPIISITQDDSIKKKKFQDDLGPSETILPQKTLKSAKFIPQLKPIEEEDQMKSNFSTYLEEKKPPTLKRRKKKRNPRNRK